MGPATHTPHVTLNPTPFKGQAPLSSVPRIVRQLATAACATGRTSVTGCSREGGGSSGDRALQGRGLSELAPCPPRALTGGLVPLSLHRAPQALQGPVCNPRQTHACSAAKSGLQKACAAVAVAVAGPGRGSPGCRPAAGSCTSTCRPPRCAVHPRAPGRCWRSPPPRHLQGGGGGNREPSGLGRTCALLTGTPPPQDPPPSHFSRSN